MDPRRDVRSPIAGVLGAALLAGCAASPAVTSEPSSIGPPASVEGSVAASIGAPPSAGDEVAWIAYQTDRGGREGVWLMHQDGSDDHEVAVDVPGEHLHPDWSPDGTQLVLTSRAATDTLYLLDVATDEGTVLWECETPCIGDDEAVWSPDGARIAFVRAVEPVVDGVPTCVLMAGDVATRQLEALTNAAPCTDRPTFAHWSRDGTRLAYYRGTYDDDGTSLGSALYVLEIDIREETKLTEDDRFAGDADWSLEDEWIVFSTYPLNDFGCCAVSNLYRIHPDGTGIEQLTEYEGEDVRATQPRYTPDGAWILFTLVTPDSRVPALLSADGEGEPIELAEAGVFTHATWQPGRAGPEARD